MVTQIIQPQQPNLDIEDPLYPSGDGQPMAENTEQYRLIVLIAENLRRIFAGRPVFIAADLLWYPVQAHEVEEGELRSQAPDVMVAFGRPAGFRMSYKQWEEENVAPQVVFEILSQSNKTAKGQADLRNKFKFYQRYGVEEYYVYDPLEFHLEGWLRRDDQLGAIAGLGNWVSPRLGIRMEWEPGQELQLYAPDGQRFISFEELSTLWHQERLRAERERLEAQALREEADAERRRADLAQREVEALRQRLRDLGIDPA